MPPVWRWGSGLGLRSCGKTGPSTGPGSLPCHRKLGKNTTWNGKKPWIGPSTGWINQTCWPNNSDFSKTGKTIFPEPPILSQTTGILNTVRRRWDRHPALLFNQPVHVAGSDRDYDSRIWCGHCQRIYIGHCSPAHILEAFQRK